MPKIDLFLVVYSHKYGEDYSIYKTRGKADKRKKDIELENDFNEDTDFVSVEELELEE